MNTNICVSKRCQNNNEAKINTVKISKKLCLYQVFNNFNSQQLDQEVMPSEFYVFGGKFLIS